MTYDEKLQKIVSKLKDERDLTRKGHKTKVTFDDASFTKVRIQDICKILLKLQDDEKILTILDSYIQTDTYFDPYEQAKDDNYDNVDIIIVELSEAFDIWYEKYLMSSKTSLENLNFINMLRIYDTTQDINEQIQLTQSTTVYFPLIPSLIRYRVLFPTDTVGFRDEYCQNRIGSLIYLKEKGAITDFSQNAKGWDTTVTTSVVLSKFEDFYQKIVAEYVKHNKITENTAKEVELRPNDKEKWPNDFVWDGETYIFGKFGTIDFDSEDRKHIFKVLTDKKGGWATINDMKGNKDAGYVRSTIKQIEDRLPKEVKKKIKILSTKDDDIEEKPKVGAYKIRILP
jgi:hypothetical protein